MSFRHYDIKVYFEKMVKIIEKNIKPGERYSCLLSGETTDYVRINHSLIRQPSAVSSAELLITYVRGGRSFNYTIPVSLGLAVDRVRIKEAISFARSTAKDTGARGVFTYSRKDHSSVQLNPCDLNEPARDVQNILKIFRGLDMVGLYSSGVVYRGYANYRGQHNWFQTYKTEFSYSIFSKKNKVVSVKNQYSAGRIDVAALAAQLGADLRTLKQLERPMLEMCPGDYRVYLSPEAMASIFSCLATSSFSFSERKDRVSPLLALAQGKKKLSDKVSLFETAAPGLLPNFNSDGFAKPRRLGLIKKGKLQQMLISPSSGKHFNLKSNGAEIDEMPQGLEMSGGEISQAEILKKIGTGIYVGSLWYVEFSDMINCQLVGYTRNDCFWVEDGKIVAPVDTMRFYDSVYRILSPTNLEGLTRRRQLMFNSDNYEQRSLEYKTMPGAIIKKLKLIP